MTIQSEFAAAMRSAGNKQSSIDSYIPHLEQFIWFVRSFHRRPIDRHEVTAKDVYQWRNHLANERRLAPKSINQAIAAVKFLFAKVLGRPIDEPDHLPLRVKEPQHQRRRLVSKQQLVRIFESLKPADRLVAQLAYASALRLDDVLNLRIKDLNFDNQQIEVSSTKHDHFRIVPFPRSIHNAVKRQIESVSVIHRHDQHDNPNGVPVPHQFARKSATAPNDLIWYWLFPSGTLSRDPADRRLKRYHRDADHYRKVFKRAVHESGINRRVTCHDLRRSAATHLHHRGMPLKRLQEILGHKSLETTQLYIFGDESSISGSDSPFDDLPQN